MSIRVFNTLTNRKEEFVPVEPGKVKFYLCGPTVYDYFHIGNARPFIIFDVYRRFLEYRGFDVTFVVNITDVDDKIIKRAQEENRAPEDVAAEYSRAYLEDIRKLKIKPADIQPRATEHIQDMIQLIQELLDNGLAYPLNGDIYYHVAKFADYGRLSGKKIDELQAGARIEVDDRKLNPLDFALWKAAKPGEPAWKAPWGKGRPGWHIECSAMSMKYLGRTFDIHAGGEDLIFPHHENEIAQSCGSGRGHFARYWMHNGFLIIRGQKMSKSLGNFLTVREILKTYRPEVIRLFFLQKHYRSPINYSEEILTETENAWRRLQHFYEELVSMDLGEFPAENVVHNNRVENALISTVLSLKSDAIAAMDDDFNSALAVGRLFEMVKEGYRYIGKKNLEDEDRTGLNLIKDTLEEFDSFLGILGSVEEDTDQEKEILNQVLNLILDVRKELRRQKNWELADKIRDDLRKIGYAIEDRADGSVVRKIN